VAERDVKGATRADLANLMVGRAVAEPKAEKLQPGAEVLQLKNISCVAAQHMLTDVNLVVRSREILGIAGVSGNGQSLLAAIVSGTVAPHSGLLKISGRAVGRLTPRAAVASGVGRIPEDRHSEGLIGDMTIIENVIAETCRDWPPTRLGLVDWNMARDFAVSIIQSYQVKCQGPQERVRLLSGGNMQKLILGRVMARNPAVILANQPTRGLDVGAVAYVHEQLLAARARGAGILLISEDLDELLALSDRIAVAYRGRLSGALLREQVTLQDLGLMMGGFGFDDGSPRHAA
jgi:simple sugar transport system ATP-binding protein